MCDFSRQMRKDMERPSNGVTNYSIVYRKQVIIYAPVQSYTTWNTHLFHEVFNSLRPQLPLHRVNRISEHNAEHSLLEVLQEFCCLNTVREKPSEDLD